jgi:hypothetical protein
MPCVIFPRWPNGTGRRLRKLVNGRPLSLPDRRLSRGRGAKRAFKISEAEQSAAPDCLQRPLRCRFRQQFMPSVRLSVRGVRGDGVMSEAVLQ